MVVFIHSHNIGDVSMAGNAVLENGYSSFFQDFISYGISLTAVPLFFLISGYLFYFNFKGTKKEFITKFKKRFKSLTIPYLFWSTGVVLLFFVLQLIPGFQSVFGSKLIIDYSFNELLTKLFLNPIPFQLWFLRDLILLVVLSPIIYWLIRLTGFYFIIILFITWVFNFDYVIFENRSILFFSLGAILSINKTNLLLIDFSRYYRLYSFLWFALVLIKTILLFNEYQDVLIMNILQISSILFGVLSIWSLYDFFFKDKDLTNSKFYKYSSFSFFIFVFHVPIFSIIRRGLFIFLGKSEFSSLIIYMAVPFITILLGISLGGFLKQSVPKFYNVITGSR